MCPGSDPPTEFSLEGAFSQEAKHRSGGNLSRVVQQFHGQPDVIGMHGGLPPASVFPFTSLSFTSLDPFAMDAASGTQPPPGGPAPATAHPASGRGAAVAASELATLQQYNLDNRGFAPLREWLQELMVKMHAPARPDTTVTLTAGNSLSIDTIFRMLLDPGDVVLVESFMYSQVYELNMAPRGLVAAPVDIDDEGMQPEALEAAIQGVIARTGRAPKVLYTVPHAHNPTGCSMSMARKRAVYAICRHHDVFIVEDDPYIYLQFPETGDDMPGLNVEPGFLHLDADGRVLRLDTFSKILAPGLRLGWATGAPAVLKHFEKSLFGASFGPAGVSQALTYSLLSQWGHAGFEAYLRRLQGLYCRRARTLAAALREHCGSAVSVRWPAGGMFLWATVPMVDDFEDLMPDMVAHKVVAVPGRYFSPRSADPRFKCKSARMAFCNLSDDELQEGARRFAALLRSYAARCAAPPPAGGGRSMPPAVDTVPVSAS